jgi:branched-chain amino acid transport system ATP-binding protein
VDPPTVLRTTGLTWRVGGYTIVHDVDLAVGAGEFMSIIGPNGAGKTTIINLLSGVLTPTEGSIELFGADISGLRPAARTRRGMGRTFQTSSLFARLTVHENARLAAQVALGHSLSLWRRPRSGDAASARAAEALDEVGLGGRAGELVAGLNHGDKRKLEIAVVLCSDPQLLLLDEPTAGVSAEDVEPLVDVVRRVHRAGRTVVMVEHRMELVTDLSDRIAVMHHGELLRCDTPAAVVADATVRQAYLGTTV